MKHVIQANLLGAASLLLDGVPVSFPYRQVEAAAYYLLLTKNATRSALADLIWGDRGDEEKIKSNLRNACYIIRKVLGKDFLLEKQNGVFCLNPEYTLEVDAARFLENRVESLRLYRGDFLEGFYLRDNELYNEWVERNRQYFKGIYVEKLHAAISGAFTEGDFARCEKNCALLQQADELDEFSYLFSMKLSLAQKNPARALQIYQQAKSTVETGLLVPLGRELTELSQQAQKLLRQQAAPAPKREPEPTQELFYGREQELRTVQTELEAFFAGKPCHSVLILGEAGVGKTELARRALPEGAVPGVALCVRISCYHAEEKYILKPWQNALRQLLDFMGALPASEAAERLVKCICGLFPFFGGESGTSEPDDISTMEYGSVQSMLVSSIVHFSKEHPLLFFFDDIQWADEVSLSFLRSLMTDFGGGRLFFLFTARSGISGEPSAFTEDMQALHKLKVLPLPRFDYSDTVRLVSLLLPDQPLTDAVKLQLFRETEGNAFFITEVINNIRYNGSPGDITPNMRNIIKQRLDILPDAHKQVLSLLSLFFDGASFEILSEMWDKDEDSLIEILESLLGLKLIKEEPGQNDTFFSFTHQKLLEHVYAEMSWTRKRLLHDRAGLCYERRLPAHQAGSPLFTKLIYHFERGANQSKYLKYTVRYLALSLNAAHEYFPTVERSIIPSAPCEGGGVFSQLTDQLDGMEHMLHTVESKIDALYSSGFPGEENLEALSDFFHIMGRYHIRKSNYKKGLEYIHRLKELNPSPVSDLQLQNIVKANRQLICVYINRYELGPLSTVAEESIRLLESAASPVEEIAVWKRLQGLGSIMAGDVEQGERLLREAIAIFEASGEQYRYLYNLAACYAWLGEAQRNLGCYSEANRYYIHAIDLCRQNFLAGGVCIFYTYYGMSLLDSGNTAAAKEQLRLAVDGYERVHLMWGRGLASCYSAQIALFEQSYADALHLLQNAWEYAVRLESPYEKGVIMRVYAQIKAQTANTALQTVFSPLLPEDAAFYRAESSRLLQGIYSPVDKSYLAAL